MAESSEKYDPSTYWLAPSRNFRTSARLHLQHLLFQNTLGCLLEPQVQSFVSGSKQLKVADLGCGNGVWLNNLHDELSAKGISAQLDGYDIKPTYFPAAAHLPPSVTLKKLDVLERPLPEDMVGAYDVVHVRAFASIIHKSNLTPLLSTALALLKPGGWLQWEEARVDAYLVDAPTPETSTSACETIVRVLQAGGEARGSTFEWLGQLDRGLSEHGFAEVRVRGADTRPQDWKAWTEDYLIVWEELAVFFPPRAEQPQAPMAREDWVALFARAVEETEQGVAVHNKQVVAVVGRKPT
ncbi:S-adenosyl-L-methionine-dependent methyltransferase [Hypoxylon sp. FL1284]|nr:S-adenosyl-L-methionine-dependent methyltransferase [Hypoxylon sp. FL1284]